MTASPSIRLAYEVDGDLIRRASKEESKLQKRGILNVLIFVLGRLLMLSFWAALFVLSVFILRKFDVVISGSETIDGLLLALPVGFLYIWLLEAMEIRAALGTDADRRMEVTLDSAGVQINAQDLSTRCAWPAIDQVVTFKGGFGLTIDTLVIAIPAKALPHELTVDDIVAQIERWRQSEAIFG